MSEPLAYLNGAFVPASQARLPVYDYGVVQGAIVVEQSRTFAGRPFRLEEHFDRFAASLARLGIGLACTSSELFAISERLLANNFPLASAELGLIHLATPGAFAPYSAATNEPVDAGPTLCVHTYPLPVASWRDKYQNGVRLATPGIRQIPAECLPPHVKSRSRLHYYLAEREVRERDPTAWALLLDMEGRLSETSAANVLLVSGNELRSPRFDCTLAGVSRQTVFELARLDGMTIREGDWTLADAQAASEVLLTSTGFCLLAAACLNGQPIGDGRPGPVYHRLLSAYESLVGQRFSHA